MTMADDSDSPTSNAQSRRAKEAVRTDLKMLIFLQPIPQRR